MAFVPAAITAASDDVEPVGVLKADCRGGPLMAIHCYQRTTGLHEVEGQLRVGTASSSGIEAVADAA